MVNLLQGTYRAFEAVADSAGRVTARSIMARRNICLSQIAFKDSNASKELMGLPMGGKQLFQGQFSETMHKYATFSRDARETSDYASTSGKQGQKRGFNPEYNSGPAFKKQATGKGPSFSQYPAVQVQVQGQNRKITFKDRQAQRPNRGGSSQRFQFQRKQTGKGPMSGQQY